MAPQDLLLHTQHVLRSYRMGSPTIQAALQPCYDDCSAVCRERGIELREEP